MPARQAMPLAAAARLFRELRDCNQKSIHRTGDINVSDLADCIDKALQDEVNRRGVMLAIAEFVGTALDGAAIDPKTWKPLARLTPRR
jgi:hypothetical protein